MCRVRQDHDWRDHRSQIYGMDAENTAYVAVRGDCGLTTMFISCTDDLGKPEIFDKLIDLADILAACDFPLDTPSTPC